eukprot:CAMPEP_0119536694 /NCGR_PEP_ID=MMETSP1344-20130328/49477_1 /TAXON_ID=236787 /ORGANISM="Florenciella parvula, Strain CCMP2471" /LENGTH=75 /DNA_ID=CAMNT_0007578849 /DNA_START=530 /DNA_END=758 /DNA_ORIENTATION=-
MNQLRHCCPIAKVAEELLGRARGDLGRRDIRQDAAELGSSNLARMLAVSALDLILADRRIAASDDCWASVVKGGV